MIGKLLLSVHRIKILDFQVVLMISIIAFLLQIVSVLCEVFFVVGMIYCPLIYLYKKNTNSGFIIKRNYNILFTHMLVFMAIIVSNLISHDNLVYMANILFFVIYLMLIKREIRHQEGDSVFSNTMNIISLYNYFTLLSIFILITDLFEKNFKKIFDFDLTIVFIGMLLICIVFSVMFLLTLKEEVVKEEKDPDFGNIMHLSLSKKYKSDLAQKIILFFETQDVYLNPNFTLKNLSDILGKSRESVSEVMNNEMKYGFYNIMARYRIEHAKKIILENDNLTIEALVVKCGFHSKSTFNKYFKMFVGQLPSAFRKNK